MAQGIKYNTEEERIAARRESSRKWRDKADRSEYYRNYQANMSAEKRQAKAERQRIKRKEDPERFAKYSRESYHRNKNNKTVSRNKEYGMFYAARKRANAKGLDFSISIEDVVIKDSCPCCSQPMVRPSLDKIKPSLGYVKGNVEVICFDCNVIKSYGTAERHRQIANYIDSYRDN